MLLPFFALAHTDAQQSRHDRDEWVMSQRIEAAQETISDIWRPNAKLVSDYKKVRVCYTEFHLHQAPNCNAELAIVEGDLGNLEVARAEHSEK
jgi:hypothetical protein